MAITATIPGGAVQLTGNRVKIECSGGALPAGATEYKILLKIISVDSKLEGAPFTVAKPMDGDGNAIFNISGYVDQPVDAVFQWPVNGVYVAYASQAFKIKVQPGERYIDSDGDLQTNWGAESAEFQMLKGGLSPRQVALMRDYGYTFYEKYLVAGKFLTARPWGESIHPDQPVKLWFIPVANATVNLILVGKYEDGTEVTVTAPVILNTANLYELNCNPIDRGLDIETEAGKLSFFDVSLEGVSESRRFNIDHTYCERPAFIMFANTFGGVDNVYFSGTIKDKFSTTGTVNYRPPLETDTVFTPTLISHDKRGQNRWGINTGWKSLTYIQYLRDLLVSKQAWYLYSNLTQSSFNIIPVTEIKSGEELIDRSKDLYALDIEFSEAHESKHSFDNRSF